MFIWAALITQWHATLPASLSMTLLRVETTFVFWNWRVLWRSLTIFDPFVYPQTTAVSTPGCPPGSPASIGTVKSFLVLGYSRTLSMSSYLQRMEHCGVWRMVLLFRMLLTLLIWPPVFNSQLEPTPLYNGTRQVWVLQEWKHLTKHNLCSRLCKGEHHSLLTSSLLFAFRKWSLPIMEIICWFKLRFSSSIKTGFGQIRGMQSTGKWKENRFLKP